MKYPNFSQEKKLWAQGYAVIGLDEAGRGPLAGPVVAAAVLITKKQDTITKQIPNINDSKKLNEKQRERFYQLLTTHSKIQWGIGVVSEKIIDKINILEATKLAMHNALENLYYKYKSFRICSTRDFLLIDGNFKIETSSLRQGFGLPKQKSIVAGDRKVFSITAAGIIAKVTRDRIMRQLHEQHPQYGFDRHKGYGTPGHLASLEQFGPCVIHRRTFFPVGTYSQD